MAAGSHIYNGLQFFSGCGRIASLGYKNIAAGGSHRFHGLQLSHGCSHVYIGLQFLCGCRVRTRIMGYMGALAAGNAILSWVAYK